MLGFGDIVLPGLLVVFTKIWDLKQKHTIMQGHFLPTISGYGLGLIVTYVALVYSIGGSQGQPALLWLVPCTLGAVLLSGTLRREWHALWLGRDGTKDDGNREELHQQSQDEQHDHLLSTSRTDDVV